ncbi:ubiquitin carboxyl-terminal hydrolase 37-like isoform X2 [Salvelinus sp. IW2-2015]|uniref:ubiquitin carboxyl-terminal hydrolase 37-like isoform X2 n=1 Tax=Salvelinus sp. IW2-2015 TaxID=2691554 RepID=UPI0038D419E2
MLCQLKEEGMILKTLGVNYSCPVSQLEFQLVSVRTCTSCGCESSTREDYNHLSLDFSPERTLLSSLALTFKGEQVEFTCEGCKGLHALKVEQFHTLPLVLVLHLKRFGGPGGLEKLEAPLLFPSELRLSTLCGDMVPHLHSASPQALTNQAPSIQGSIPQTLVSQVSSPPGEAKYSALCCSGHYISDILHASGNWFCCNDSQVSMSNEATVLRTRARSAYMLFYMFRYCLLSPSIFLCCYLCVRFLLPYRAREREAPAHRA